MVDRRVAQASEKLALPFCLQCYGPSLLVNSRGGCVDICVEGGVCTGGRGCRGVIEVWWYTTHQGSVRYGCYTTEESVKLGRVLRGGCQRILRRTQLHSRRAVWFQLLWFYVLASHAIISELLSTSWGGRMSKASSSRSGRLWNPKITVSNLNHLVSNTG